MQHTKLYLPMNRFDMFCLGCGGGVCLLMVRSMAGGFVGLAMVGGGGSVRAVGGLVEGWVWWVGVGGI